MSKELYQLLRQSKNVVFFGGAGVSTESDIPDFRSNNGIFRKKQYEYSAETLVSIDMFHENPQAFYEFYFNEMVYPNAVPNNAHRALVELEKQGIVSAVITQNIDGLHQLAGSKNVIELHGNIHQNHCVNCHKAFSLDYMLNQKPPIPRCDECGDIIKCDVVLYGEALNEQNIQQAINYIRSADLLIVGGTSLSVYPASGLLQYYRGAKIVVINKTHVDFDNRASLVIHEPIGEVFAKVMELWEKR